MSYTTKGYKKGEMSIKGEVKEVDLNAAVEHYVEQHKSELNGYFDIRRIARYFFELGLSTERRIV